MDKERALATYREAVAADPEDAAAYRGLASALWLSITFRRGNMTVDEFLGRVNRTKTPPTPPPAEEAAAFDDALGKAMALSRKRLDANSRDADAHFQLGAAAGLRASYTATVEGKALGAFRAARDAYDEHSRVLSLDGRRKDAGLIVGTYRYIVSALGLPARLFAYMAGFGGGKERGMTMIEEATTYGGDNQVDARLALILIYNREKRYDDALRQLATLREQFPRNRLLWLETGATNLRAGRAGDALRFLTDGLARSARDDRPRRFGEEALWLYKLGASRATLGQRADAEKDLRKAVALMGRPWVLGRAHLELGKLALAAGKTADARQELRTAAALCDSDNDGATADDARRLMK